MGGEEAYVLSEVASAAATQEDPRHPAAAAAAAAAAAPPVGPTVVTGAAAGADVGGGEQEPSDGQDCYVPSADADPQDGSLEQQLAQSPPTEAAMDAQDADADGSVSGVEAQVAAFVSSVLQPLLAAGVVSAGLGEVVVGKAVEKVMGRHAGAVDGGFLVREYAAITRLVTSLVDHYQQKRQ
jgi:hypothetical protein